MPNGSLYASADAARVGEGLYSQLVEATCLLASDPFPRVARLGKAALLVADVELVPQPIPQHPSRSSLSERPGTPLSLACVHCNFNGRMAEDEVTYVMPDCLAATTLRGVDSSIECSRPCP